MERRIAICLLIAATPTPALADTLYKCTSPDGRIVYTNQKTLASCQIISQDKPVSTFSPPPLKPRPPTPADFPRVEGAQQKARDADRRTILEQELANEQKLLDAARKTLQEQENTIAPEDRIAGGGINLAKREERLKALREEVERHERNIEALRKELAGIR